MANGDSVYTADPQERSYQSLYALLDGQTGTSDGAWVDLRVTHGTKLVEVSGIGTGTVQLRGSIAATQPADSAHGSQIGSDITADGFVTVMEPVRWMKARKTVAGGSTATTVMLRSGRYPNNRGMVG